MHTLIRLPVDGDSDNYRYSVGYFHPRTKNCEGLRDCGGLGEATEWVSYLNGGGKPSAAYRI
jgi:hypothetical protein